MKGLKYISVLLLVNISVMIGHNLVPHQHHVASESHPSSHECPHSNHEHHAADSGSKHCHAFNDITFVKYNFARLPMPEKLSCFIIIADPGAVPGINYCLSQQSQAVSKLIFLSAEITGSHSLRGPPTLA